MQEQFNDAWYLFVLLGIVGAVLLWKVPQFLIALGKEDLARGRLLARIEKDPVAKTNLVLGVFEIDRPAWIAEASDRGLSAETLLMLETPEKMSSFRALGGPENLFALHQTGDVRNAGKYCASFTCPECGGKKHPGHDLAVRWGEHGLGGFCPAGHRLPGTEWSVATVHPIKR